MNEWYTPGVIHVLRDKRVYVWWEEKPAKMFYGSLWIDENREIVRLLHNDQVILTLNPRD